MKYLKKLKEIDLSGKIENQIGNILEDEGFDPFFKNLKYLELLEKMLISSKGE